MLTVLLQTIPHRAMVSQVGRSRLAETKQKMKQDLNIGTKKALELNYKKCKTKRIR